MFIRLIGALIGFQVLGIIGVFLGFFIASAIHRYFSYGPGAVNPLSGKHRQAVFVRTVFSLMGKLAKSDGRISESEIAHVEQFMAQQGMTTEHRQEAIGFFKNGARAEFDIAPLLDEFMAVCGHTTSLKQVLLTYLLGVAMADGVLHPEEEKLMRQVAQRLGFDQRGFEQMMNMLKGQGHFSGGHQQNAKAGTSTSALQSAYAALGVTEQDTDADIKKAYRRLMSQYHPDKLTGQGVPEDMIRMATEKTKEIQAAYDLVKKSRGQ